MQHVLATQNAKLADVNTMSLMDTSFVRRLEDSGILAQLQARYRE